jgi:hypothetical protein
MQPEIILTVIFTGYMSRGPTFDATISDRVVVRRSTQPLLDACRVLLAEGVASSTTVAMRHAGSEVNALSTTVGYGAKLTVVEGDDRRPTFVRWTPSIYASVRPPSDLSDGRATRVAPGVEATQEPPKERD